MEDPVDGHDEVSGSSGQLVDYKKPDGSSSADLAPEAPRFSAAQGVCDFCYRMLLDSGTKYREHVITHYNTVLELYCSSFDCPCCSVLLWSLPEKYDLKNSPYGKKHDKDTGLLNFHVVRGSRRQTSDRILVFASHHNIGGLIESQWLDLYSSEALVPKSPIWLSTFSNIPLSLRRAKILECIDEYNGSHTDCNADTTRPPPLPTRVLDVGDSKGKVKLISTSGLQAWYIALSHCWGELQPLTTTSDTLHDRKQAIDLYLLPKTFRDAIEVSRDLGIRYLWIDSLCIIQDDVDDWETESAQMAMIYQNAYLTISATAASDGSGGLDWPIQPSKQFRYDSNKTPFFRREEYTYNTIVESPLGKRAWVLQETMLSRRVIHFAADQLYWACGLKHDSEDGLADTERALSVRNLGLLSVGRISPQPTPMTASQKELIYELLSRDSYRTWHGVSTAYSALSLTKITDKLAALAGITMYMQSILKDTPFLGLWVNNLKKDLLWRGRKTSSLITNATGGNSPTQSTLLVVVVR